MPTEPLSAMLRGFIDRWQIERPQSGGAGVRTTEGGVSHVGPVKWLAAETGIPERTITNVSRGRSRTTELRIADPIVQALGHPEAFHNGTLEIQASSRAKAPCCGSLNGSL